MEKRLQDQSIATCRGMQSNQSTKASSSILKSLSVALCVLFSVGMQAQTPLSGTINVPSAGYVNLKDVIDSLNTNGVGGAVTVNITAGNNQVAPNLGYRLGSAVLNASLSATNTITFNGNGNSIFNYANPTSTRTGSNDLLSGAIDAIFVVEGADFLTFNNITFADTSASTSQGVLMEAGLAFFNLVDITTGNVDGSQNITITNCTFNMSESNFAGYSIWANGFIYGSTSGLTWASIPNQHRNFTITNNTFNTGHMPIGLRGRNYTVNEAMYNVTISNNTVNSLGGGTSISYGIYPYHCINATITNNTINFASNAGGTTYGIYTYSTAGNVLITNNTITIDGGATSAAYGIYHYGYVYTSDVPVLNNIKIKHNTILTGPLTATTPTSSKTIYGIYGTTNYSAYYDGATTFYQGNLEIDSNTFSGQTIPGAGTVYPFYAASAAGTGYNTIIRMRGNKVNNNIFTGQGGTKYMIYSLSANTVEVSGNEVMNNTFTATTGTSSGTIAGIYASGSTTAGTTNVFNNIVSNLTSSQTTTAINTISGIFNGSMFEGNFYNNIINNIGQSSLITTKTTNVYGVQNAAATTSVINYFNNTIDSLRGSGTAGLVDGILNSSTGTSNLYNNQISELYNYNSINVNGTNGIRASSSGALNATHNTITFGGLAPLTSTSTTSFGGSGITFNTGTTNLRNNIVNIQGTPGATGGAFVAVRALTTGTANVKPANISASNNLYYVNPNNNNYIYAQGTTATSLVNAYYVTGGPNTVGTLDANFNTACGIYKSFMQGENGTAVENNLTLAGGYYTPTGSSFAESSAVAVAGITTDISGATRSATSDMGAKEFSGTANDIAAPTIQFSKLSDLFCTPLSVPLAVNITDASGINTTAGTKPRVYFKKSTEIDTFGANTAAADGWKFVEATNTTSPFNFSIDFSLLNTPLAVGDIIQYFVTAQDNAATANVSHTGTITPSGLCPTSVNIGATTGLTNYATATSFEVKSAATIMFQATSNPVCSGLSDTIRAILSAPGIVQVGTGTLTGTATQQTPFGGGWGGTKTQYIIRASELQALGLSAGPISSIAITAASSAATYEGFQIWMTNTSLNTLTAATMLDSSVMTKVYEATGALASYTPTVGVNTFAVGTSPATPLGSPVSPTFDWDGSSNLLICFSHSENPTSGNVAASSVQYTVAPFASSAWIQADNQSMSAMLGALPAAGTSSASSNRPNFIINGNKGPAVASYAWNNTKTTQTIIENPTTTPFTRYICTITDVTSCVVTDTIDIDVNPLPAAPSVTNGTQCGLGLPTCSVSSTITGATFNWYASNTATTPLQSDPSTTYLTEINDTTTFFVSVVDPTTGCEGPRAAVTQIVNPADSLIVTANNTLNALQVCLGDTVNLSAANGVNPPTMTYTSFTWNSSDANSGLAGPLTGATQQIIPLTKGNYTLSVTAASATCAIVKTIALTVKDTAPFYSVTVNPNPACAGSTVDLRVVSLLGEQDTALTSNSTSTSNALGNSITPGGWGGARTQYIIRGSELQSMGFLPGPITGLGVFPTNSSDVYQGFQIWVGHTTLNAFSAFTFTDSSLLTKVYEAPAALAAYTPVANQVNMFDFGTIGNPAMGSPVSSSFNWDGVSNLMVLVSFSKNPLASNSIGTSYRSQTLSWNASSRNQNDQLTMAQMLGSNGATTSFGGQRPVFYVKGLKGKDITDSVAWLWGAPANLASDSGSVIMPAGGANMPLTGTYKGCVSTQNIALSTAVPPFAVVNSFNGPTDLCTRQSGRYNVLVEGGCVPYTFAWSVTGGSGTFTTVPQSNLFKDSVIFTPTGPSGLLKLKVTITDNSGASIIDSFDVNYSNPFADTLVNDTICGVGAGNVAVVPSDPNNQIFWYADSASAQKIATGPQFATPFITQSTCYWAEEANVVQDSGVVTQTLQFGFAPPANYGIIFNANTNFRLNTVQIRPYGTPGTAGSITIELQNSFGIPIGSVTRSFTVPAGNTTAAIAGTSAPVILPLGFNVPVGTGYRLVVTAFSGATGLVYGSTVTFPATSPGGGMTITNGWFGTGTTATNYFLLNPGFEFGCWGARQKVCVEVQTPPTLTLNNGGPIQICNPTTNQAVDTVKVTSPLANYNTYTWNNTAVGSAANGWLFESTAAGQDTFILTAENTVTGCIAYDTVLVNPVPYGTSLALVADKAEHCLSATSNINVVGTPSIGATYQWQTTTNYGVTWNNIPTATNISYNTGLLTDSAQYRVVISCGGTPIPGISPSPVIDIAVNNPSIDSVKNDTICGVGTAQLEAFVSGSNSVRWYNDANAVNFVSTSNTFTTPTLTSTDTFYVAPVNGITQVSGGKLTNGAVGPILTATGSALGASPRGMHVRADIPTIIDSVGFLCTGVATNVTFALYDSVTSAIVGTSVTQAIPANAGTAAAPVLITVPANIPVTTPGAYKLMVSAVSAGAGLFYEFGLTPNPYPAYNVGNYFRIWNASTSLASAAPSTNTYYYFYKVVVKEFCEGARQPVIANVIAPPALTLSQVRDTVCSGDISDVVTLTSGASNFNTFNWTVNNASATLPIGNVQGTGATFDYDVPGSYRYILEAEQTTGLLCKNQDTFDFVVNRIPSAFTIDPATSVDICNGSTQELRATSGFIATANFGTATTAGIGTGQTPFMGGWGGTKTEYIITAAEMTAAGMQAGPINSLTFFPTSNGDTYQGFQVYIGNTALAAFPATPVATSVSSLTKVYEGTGALAEYTITPNVPNELIFGTQPASPLGDPAQSQFLWDGTSNIMILMSWSKNPTAFTSTASNCQFSPVGFNASAKYQDDALSMAAMLNATGSSNAVSTNRPNFVLKQNSKFPITWSPTTALFRNSSASLAYAGTNRDTVWAAPNDTISYVATATHPNGCKVYDTVQVNVKDSVQILTQAPLTTQLCAGQSFTLKPTFASTSPMTYQWKKWNGTSYVNVTGATADSFTIANAAVSDGGRYICEVSTGTPCSAKLTDTSNVTVFPGLTITTQPNASGALTICQGQPFTLTSAATGQASMQWKRIVGGTTSNYGLLNDQDTTIAASTLADSGLYFVHYTLGGICGTAVSDTVKVTIVPAAFVSTDPIGDTICAGQNVTFTATTQNASGFAWTKNGLTITAGGNITITNTGSTQSVLTISNATATDAGNYRLIAQNVGSCVADTSAIATLGINAKPSITSTTLPSTTVCAGTTMSFAVTASNNSRVVWFGGASGTDSIQNATSFTLPATAGIYSVKVIGNSPCGDTTSASVTTTVTPLATITTQPSATTVCEGSALSLTLAASNADSIVWFRGTTRVGTGTTYSVSAATSADSANYSAVAYSASGCTNATSNVVLGAVTPKAIITTQPAANTYVLTGSNATVTMAASNFDSIVWYKGATRISNGATLSITNFDSATQAGKYTARVYSNAPCTDFVVSDTANIIKSTCPVITTQPIGDTLCVGSTYTLSVTAGAVNTYEWYKVGNTTPIATTSSTALNLNTLTSGGSYYVKLSPLTGCTTTVTSDTVKVGVDDSTRITAQPTASTTICSGSALNLSVTATGTGTLSYQWMNGSTNVGTNSNSFSVSSAATSDAGTYKVVVSSTSACPSATSSNAVVNVTPAATITTQPSASTVCQGSTLSFSITASNADSIGWFRGTTKVGTGSTYSKTNAQAADSGNYVAIVYRGAGCSDVSSNSVLGAVKPQATITTQPQVNTYVLTGSNASVTIAANNFDSIVWFKGSTRISNGATLNITNFDSATHAGAYTARVYSQAPCTNFVASTTANIIKSTCPVITVQPVGDTLCAGSNYTLSVTAGAVDTYEWFKVGTASSIGSSSSLTLNNLTTSNAGSYFVKLNPLTGCATSKNSDTIKIGVDAPIAFTTNLSATTQNFCVGQNMNLSVAVSGTGPFTYSWKEGTTNVGSNQNSFAKTTTAGVFTYNVQVSSASGACPSVTSNTANVQVNNAPSNISISGFNSPYCVGNSLSLTANGNDVASYTWTYNSANTTGSTFTRTLAASDNGKTVTLTANALAGCNSVSTTTTAIAVNQEATISVSPSNVLLQDGANQTLTATTTNSPDSVVWFKDGVRVGSGATYTITGFDSATHHGTYVARAYNKAPCSGFVPSANVDVFKTTCPAIAVNGQPVGDTICEGSSFTLNVSAVAEDGYQWYRNNQMIANATSANYNVSNASNANHSGWYKVFVKPLPSTSGCPTLFSDSVFVKVDVKPVFTSQPTAPINCTVGALHTMTVSTNVPSTFQWYKDGVAMSGKTLSTITVDSTQISKTYYVEATNGVCPPVASNTVVVEDRNPSTLLSLATSKAENLEAQCKEGNWTYYAEPGNRNVFLMAINHNGNNVTFRPDIDFNTNGTKEVFDGTTLYGAVFGERMFNVDVVSGTLTAPYDVKFYYDNSEMADVASKYDAKKVIPGFKALRDSMSWLTSVSVPFNPALVNSLTKVPVLFPHVIQTAVTKGIEAGINFVTISNMVTNNGGGTMYIDYRITSGSAIKPSNGSEAGFKMFPIPAVTELKVEINNKTLKPVLITVTDMQGRIVMSQEVRHQNAISTHPLDVSSMANGVYQITLDNGEQVLKGKFTIER